MDDGAFFQEHIRSRRRNRFWLSTLILVVFLAILGAIFYGIFTSEVDIDWGDMMYIIIGAFIASYSKVMDFWFNNKEEDKELIKRVDEEDQLYETSSENVCRKCGKQIT